MCFLVSVAVANNLHGALLTRVRELNGHDSTEGTDVFKFNLLKEYGSGLTIGDMKSFIDWILKAPPGILQSKGRIQAKLTDLKHYRMAYYHVMHPDGMVPESKSMLPILIRIGVIFILCL